MGSERRQGQWWYGRDRGELSIVEGEGDRWELSTDGTTGEEEDGLLSSGTTAIWGMSRLSEAIKSNAAE